MLCEGRPWRGWIGSYTSILTLCSALSGRRGRVTNSGTVWQSHGNHVELAWLPRGNDTESGESHVPDLGPVVGCGSIVWFCWCCCRIRPSTTPAACLPPRPQTLTVPSPIPQRSSPPPPSQPTGPTTTRTTARLTSSE